MMGIKEKLKNAICNNDLDFLVRNRNLYNINERFEDENNDTLLLYSISDSYSEVFTYFLEHGADHTLTNDLKETILHSIVFSGDIKRTETIFNNYTDINIDAQTVEQVTPLLLAISLEKYEISKFLISRGADVSIPDEEGITPLHLAVQSNDFELVKLLVDKGANLDAKTKKGNSVFVLAVIAENDSIIKYIFNKKYFDK
jgi:ankyrin repeat protein